MADLGYLLGRFPSCGLLPHCLSQLRCPLIAKSHDQRGITLLELLIVISIISLLMSLLLPAVQTARESARRTSCANNVRQLAIACHLHEETAGYLPSNGWGWTWTGDYSKGRGKRQPGGWIFNVLPYVEQETAYEHTKDVVGRTALLQTPIALFNCSSRRTSGLYPYTLSSFPLINASPVPSAAKTDYAINAGDAIVHTSSGPISDSPQAIASYAWPPSNLATGVSYVRSEIILAQIKDGSSNTIMLGEKCLMLSSYQDGTSLGDDQAMFVGDDADNRRWTAMPPQADGLYDELQVFGSAHSGGCNFALVDGSVRIIQYSVDVQTFQYLGNRRDGHAAAVPD